MKTALITGITGQDGSYLAEWLLGRPTSFQQYSTLRSDNIFNTFAAFAQDDWKVRPNLTVNLGVRYEPYFGIHDGNGEIIAFRRGQQSTLLPNAPRGLLILGYHPRRTTRTGITLRLG